MKYTSVRDCTTRAVTVAIVVVSPLTCGSVLALQTGIVAAERHTRSLTLGSMFTFFFLMLGPLKILGPFSQMTQKGDARFTRKLAVRGFFYSCLVLFFAGALGEHTIQKYNIRISVLVIAAGLILFLVALKAVMHQVDIHDDSGVKEYDPDLRNALHPLAFPTIVTPYGISAVIVFMALTPEYLVKGEIFAALFGLMLLNLVAMLLAKPILRYLHMPLLLLGTVLGVIQVALGLAIIVEGVRMLGYELAAH